MSTETQAMLQLAAEAFHLKNYELAADIYEDQLREPVEPRGRLELMVRRADALAFGGKLTEAFGVYQKASEIERLQPVHLGNLLTFLIENMKRNGVGTKKKTDPGMESVATEGCPDASTGCGHEAWSCRTCLAFLSEPVTLPCGHSLCKKCLERETGGQPVCCKECSDTSQLKDVPGYRVNVVLGNILCKWFPTQCRAAELRRQGNSLYVDKKTEEALGKYNQAIFIAPKDYLLFSNRSQIHASLRRYDMALSDAETACTLMPHWSKGHQRKAQALVSLGRSDDALKEYLLCLTLQPDCKLAKTEAQKVHYYVDLMEVLNGHFLYSYFTFFLFPEPMIGACNSVVGDLIDPTDLECSLCMRLYYEPVTTPCGHTFCLKCLERCLDHNPQCPLCKQELSQFLAERSYCKTSLMESLISTYLPADLTERSKVYHEEMAEFSNLNQNVPIFVCTMAFPTVPCPLHIFEPCYRLMIRRCMETGTRCFGMCLGDEAKGFADYGCLLEIRNVEVFADGRSVVDCIGRRRFKVNQHRQQDGYNTADIEYLEDVKVEGTAEKDLQTLHDAVYDHALVWVNSLKPDQKERIVAHFGPMPEKDSDPQASPNGPSWCWWLLAVLPLDGRAQLPFVALTSLQDRLHGIRRVLLFMARNTRHR
uniref:LON peptidase N-terminal domain and RING finger protein 3-like n=1 Tax=Gadus morhua TaxID=8049 RepID=A0A8C5ATI3_GADMO